MAHPYDNFWPYKHTAYLVAKQFLYGDELGSTFVYSPQGNWWIKESKDLPLTHEEVLEYFYQFLLSQKLFMFSTRPERFAVVEEVETAARQVSIDRQREGSA